MTLAPTPFLDNKHTIFGRVISGMRVLQRLGAVGVDAQDRSVIIFTSLLSIVDLVWLNPRIPIKT
jgi:cyclophilin family peptidyl-prolyl cis-trans isomerase